MRALYLLPEGTALPARALCALCALLASLLLVLLPLLASAATPVLRLEATVPASATDVTAFVDQVEIIDATTGLPVRNAVPNAGFETTGSLGAGSYGYTPTGASWAFASFSGIASNGSAFGSPTAPEGSRVAFLQTGSGGSGYLSQTLPNLVPGLYRVRLRVAQRNTSPANQGVRVLVDGVALGTVTPATGAFAMYNSATFVVARPSTSDVFTGGANVTTDGSTAISAGSFTTTAVTDVDGDGLLDLLVGNSAGNVLRYEQPTANSGIFAGGTALTTDGSTALNADIYSAPAVTDVDGDGLLDLLVSNFDGNVLRYEQTAVNGSVFAGGAALTTNGSTAIDAGLLAVTAVTDVEGDGLLDLLVGNRDGNVLRYEQTTFGGSIFAGGTALTTDGSAALYVGGYEAKPTVTDVDGNGLLDLLVGRDNGNVLRYEQTTVGGSIFAGGTALVGAGSYAAPTATDVDGDGLLDLVVGTGGTSRVRRFEQVAPPTALALSPQAVAENTASGTVVGTFATTDATSGDTFTYTLVAGTGSTDNASFAIGSGVNTGKLVTAAVFDFETKSSYSIRVRVTDATGYPFEQVFTISVTDVGEPAVLTSFSPASGPLGTVITITGQNLNGLSSVRLGDVPALFTVVSNTSVTLTVPRQATSQKLRISRTSGPAANQGTVLSATAFQVTRPSTSIVFPGGAALTTDGSTAIAVGGEVEATPTVTDLDGDGLLDLLLSSSDGTVLRYEQTTANGSIFAGGTPLTTDGTTALDAGNYGKPVVTDLDGNGLLDLLVSNGNSVLRYEQTTAGGLIFAGGSTVVNTGVATYPSPTVTDLDADGLLDLLVGTADGNVLRFEQSTANGLIFAGGTALTTNGSTVLAVGLYANPTVTDLDSNGRLDLLVGNYDGHVLRYEQTTAGGLVFAGGTRLTFNGSTFLDVSYNAAPAVTDVDGDGLLDLLVGNYDGNVLRYEQANPPTALALAPQAVAENAASGTVVGTFATTDATPGDTFTYTLVAGTGSTDNASFAIGTGANAGKLVTAAVFNFETKSSYSVRVRTTDATGILFEQAFTISITNVVEAPTLTSVAPGSGPLGTTLTLTGTNLTGLSSVLVGEVPALFTVTSNTSATATVPRQATSQKVRVSNAAGTALSATAFTVTRPSTSGVFPGGAALTTDGSTALNATSYSAPAVCDVDGDGLLDLLVGTFSGSIRRYEQTTANGDVFAGGAALTTNGTTAINTSAYGVPTVTDVDGDGLLDLLVGNITGTVRRYEQTTANGGNFAALGDLTTDGTTPLDAGDYAGLVVADLDSDGLLDLLVSTVPGAVQHYEQTTANASSFALVDNLTTDGTTALVFTGAVGLAITDMDSDGLLDLVVSNNPGQLRRYEQTTPGASIFPLLGFLTTNGSTNIAAGPLSKVAVTDVDGDGLLDLLVGNQAGNVLRYEQADPPTALALGPQAVAENAASGTVVGTFATTDPTSGDTFTYTLVTGTGSTDNAQFAIGSGADAGKLVTAAVFDFETKNSYTVRVRSTDATGLFTEQFFTISITNVVEAPTIASLSVPGGVAGTSVTLTGTNLSGATAVTVNGVAVTPTSATSTSLVFTVPAGAGNTQSITVTNAEGTSAAYTAFVVRLNVTSTSPAANARTAPTANSALALTFTEPVTAASIAPSATTGIKVYSAQVGGRKAGSFSRNGSTVSYTSSLMGTRASFKPGEVVSVTVPATVLGAGGLAASKKVYQFTTATGGTGRGNFQPGTSTGVGTTPFAIATGDVDGDGDLDVLTTHQSASGTVSVRLNGGDNTGSNTGVFSGGSTVAVGNDPRSMVLGDVDGDGDLDLLAANYNSNTVSVRLNGGDATGSNTGTFSNGAEVSTGVQPAAVALGDVDGDGDPDLLVACFGSSAMCVRLNGGDASGSNTGTFSNGSDTGTGNFSMALAVGDVDGDGDLDLVTTHYYGTVLRVLLNGGDATGSNTGTFSNGSTATVGLYVYNVALGDVDGDGDLDVATANPATASVSIRLNGGDATGSNTGVFSNGSDPAANGSPYGVVLGDVDGDGDLDLLASNQSSSAATVRLNGGDATGSNTGVFSGGGPVTTGSAQLSLALGDVDGDGDLDLLAPDRDAATVSVRLNQPPVPTITALSTAAELPGQAVVLTGTNFTSGSSVSFGGVAAASVSFTSSTSLTAVVPVGAAPGSSAVVVTTANGPSLGSPAFEVLQVYRDANPSGCLATASLSITGSGGSGAWRYLRLPGAGGAVVAAIEDTRNLGTVTAGFTALGTATSTAVRRDGQASRAYLDRNFFLTATSPTFTGQTVRVRFFGLSSELARLTAADGNATAATLKASQYSGSNEDCDLSNNDPTGERRLLAAPATVVAGADWFTAQVSVTDHFSEFYLTGASSPLPVQLLAFTAEKEKQGSAVTLAWRTASEKNADRFEVERSRDGRTFERLGTVAAKGSKTSPSAYTFLDDNLTQSLSHSAIRYYRLHQFDADGTASYSPVRAVAVGEKVLLTLYPNPAHGSVQVLGAKAGAALEVFDATGRRICSATAAGDGTARLALPAGLSLGVYVVKSGGQVQRLTVE